MSTASMSNARSYFTATLLPERFSLLVARTILLQLPARRSTTQVRPYGHPQEVWTLRVQHSWRHSSRLVLCPGESSWPEAVAYVRGARPFSTVQNCTTRAPNFG